MGWHSKGERLQVERDSGTRGSCLPWGSEWIRVGTAAVKPETPVWGGSRRRVAGLKREADAQCQVSPFSPNISLFGSLWKRLPQLRRAGRRSPQSPPGRDLEDAERFQVAGGPGTCESRNFADGEAIWGEETAEEALRARRHPDPPSVSCGPWSPQPGSTSHLSASPRSPELRNWGVSISFLPWRT